MQTRLVPQKSGNVLGFDSCYLAFRVPFQKILRHSLQCSSAPYARYVNIYSVTKLFRQLYCRRFVVHLRIGRILELLRHEIVRRLARYLYGLVYRASYAQFRVGQHQFCAKRPDDLLALLAHVFRHDNDHAVSLADAAERKAYSGIA